MHLIVSQLGEWDHNPDCQKVSMSHQQCYCTQAKS